MWSDCAASSLGVGNICFFFDSRLDVLLNDWIYANFNKTLKIVKITLFDYVSLDSYCMIEILILGQWYQRFFFDDEVI